MEHIPYAKQCIDVEDILAVIGVLEGETLTCGRAVIDFEETLAQAVGAKYAVALSSGTAALHLAMIAVGVSKGDEVITTPLSFAATSNSVLYCGATPIFADIDAQSMLLDPNKVSKMISPNTRAIVVVHYGGELCNMNAFVDMANEHGLSIVQDGAHSLGGLANGLPQGAYQGMQVWSFHPVKTITTGEGGAVTTNDASLYERLLRLRSHGIERASFINTTSPKPWYYEMKELGYNYRLTDIQAALGTSQLSKLSTFAKRRAILVEKYNKAFKNFPLEVQHSPDWSSPIRHLYTIRLKDTTTRDSVFNALRQSNIGVNLHYIPTYLFPYYEGLGYKKGLCPNAEDAYSRILTIPLYPSLTDAQQDYVIEAVARAVGE